MVFNSNLKYCYNSNTDGKSKVYGMKICVTAVVTGVSSMAYLPLNHTPATTAPLSS
jgi:hypothetical protein